MGLGLSLILNGLLLARHVNNAQVLTLPGKLELRITWHIRVSLIPCCICWHARQLNCCACDSLPADFYARSYGRLFEVLVSLVLCTSFISLLAGNLVGLGRIFEFCFGHLGTAGSVFLGAALCTSYTIGGTSMAWNAS